MEEKIYLKASAKLVSQLGEQLIENELVALLELIKNSYDADSTISRIIVNTEELTSHGQGKIIVNDNGHGMIPSILKNSFFKISTSFREKNNFSFKFNRQVLGEKGLGRLSFQRLGYYIRVLTKPDINILKDIITDEDKRLLEKYDTFELIIDWRNLDSSLELNEVSAMFRGVENGLTKPGTEIEILGIRNLEFWRGNRNKIELLVKEIYKMNSPLKLGGDINESDTFKIRFKLNEQLYRNDEIDEELIEQMSDSKIEFSLENLILKIKITYQYRLLLSMMEKSVASLGNFKIKEFKKDELDKFHFEEIIINLREENVDYIKYLRRLNLKKINDKYANPGDFTGKLYNVRFTAENKDEITKILESYSLENIKNVIAFKKIWDSIKGFYIYRNSFRVLPYGNDNLDWAGFDSYTKETKYMPYESKSMLGYIILNGKKCRNLKEQTNRQGFMLDEYGENFINIVKETIVRVICDRYVNLRDGFSLNLKNDKETNITSKNGLITVERIITNQQKVEENIVEIKNMIKIGEKLSKVEPLLEQIEKIEETVKIYSRELLQDQKILNLKKEEMAMVMPMVGQSIIVEALTHEFNRMISNIATSARNTIDELEKIKIENQKILKNQRDILTETIYLKEQLSHIEPMHKKSKLTKENISIKKLLVELYQDKDSPMSAKAKKEEILVEVIGQDLVINANRGYLITVFDNLFLNSLYWISVYNKERKITINVSSSGTVTFEDTGCGVLNEHKNLIFNPFFSLKPDGRGLGLYIAQGILTEMDAYIRLDDKEEKERLNKFVIKFNKIEENFILF